MAGRKVFQRKLDRNVGDHKERMAKRREEQLARKPHGVSDLTVAALKRINSAAFRRTRKISKYDPRTEDIKHLNNPKKDD